MSRRHVDRQPLMPEGAANPAAARPHPHPVAPTSWRLVEGHLDAECSIRLNGSPACPACLALELRERYELR